MADPATAPAHTAGDPGLHTDGIPQTQDPRAPFWPGLLRQSTPAKQPLPHTVAGNDSDSPPGGGQAELRAEFTAIRAAADLTAQRCADLLEAANAALDVLRAMHKPGMQRTVTVSQYNPYTLDTMGYQHSYMLIPTGSSFVFDIPGVGLVTRALNADWNRIAYPDGTRIVTANATQVNALLWFTNDNINV